MLLLCLLLLLWWWLRLISLKGRSRGGGLGGFGIFVGGAGSGEIGYVGGRCVVARAAGRGPERVHGGLSRFGVVLLVCFGGAILGSTLKRGFRLWWVRKRLFKVS